MKKVFLSIAFIGTTLFSNAQTEKSLLWEISGNGLQKPSYVYGTIHMICPDKFFVPNGLEEKLKATEQTYLEIDMDDPQMMSKTQKLMFSADGKKLKDIMNEADYKSFSDYFKKTTNMSTEMLMTAKPFAYLSMIMMKSTGCPMPKSYEEYFVKQTQAGKKELLGLETIEDQMSILDKAPTEEQVKWLMEMAKDGDKNNAMFAEMVDLYTKQDLDGLQKYMTKFTVGMQSLEKDLLQNRNEKWIPIIEKNSKEKPTFYAVGAAHLVGDKGVLNLLKQKGYTVSAVK